MSQFEKQLLSATLVCLDGNIPVSTINYVCSIAKKHNINGEHKEMVTMNNCDRNLSLILIRRNQCVSPVWYEPTDSDKASKPFLSDAWKSLSYSSPNLAELCTMNKTLGFPTPDGKRSSLTCTLWFNLNLLTHSCCI